MGHSAKHKKNKTRHKGEAHSGKKRKQRLSRRGHRWLGLLLALPLTWVLLTGVVLNHADDWGLETRKVSSSWVLNAYGMSPEGQPKGLEVDGVWVAEWDGVFLVDGTSHSLNGALRGAVRDGDGLAVVTDQAVLRVDADGEVIETLGELSLPMPPILAVTQTAEGVYLKNTEGWHLMDSAWLNFGLVEGKELSPQAVEVVQDAATLDTLRSSWAGGGVPASRLVLDLHAGHFLGAFGAYFYDFVALCTLVLIVTGVILFYRKPRRNRG
ncbi:PepSY-associated TM region [Rubritalea squalenifaciens DSM 18772]|uniref:PepSY-associated TM region n=1 Tax=Rubritalea squalenifaciens DSM 18772 TaxID=1123071 RepID=A0A1M6HMK1_9BACT|nr:PepSY domain-containing protein [Rubritalea squalenifaciens]SHJ23397.1 PepSY-associated TM region [Rubritalea squalenifaciens DSM 18772]